MTRQTENGFNLLRVMFSLFVLVSHSYPLGLGGRDPMAGLTNGQFDLGVFGVVGFFSISGFLITQSAMNSTPLTFLWKRFLRIYPAFWVVLLSVSLILGPSIWVLDGQPISTYWTFSQDGPFGYFLNNFTTHIGNWGIYNIFEDTTPWGNAVQFSAINGSLWTLFWEVSCYLVLFTFILFSPLSKLRITIPVLAFLFFISNYIGQADPRIFGKLIPVLSENADSTKFALAFFTGATLQLFWKDAANPKAMFWLSSIALLMSIRFNLGQSSLAIIATTGLVISLAWIMPQTLKNLFQKNDYSYGLYLYAFPVQMTLAYFGIHKLGTPIFTGLTLIITFAFAAASWHLVERNALKLKGFHLKFKFLNRKS